MTETISREEVLRKKREKGVVGFHKFTLKFRSNQDKIYCFVEGYDSKYYYSRVKMKFNSEPEFIKCNGKDGVVGAFKELEKHKEFKSQKLLFFVDKDFDPSLNLSRIYETPCYSIENLYSSINVLRRILKNEFNLDDDDEDFSNAMSLFSIRSKEYHDNIVLLNAWILSHKKQRDVSGRNIKLNLNNLSLKDDLINISLDNISSKYSIEEIERKLEIEEKIPQETLIANFQLLNNDQNRGSLFRGKFELEFFRLFLGKLVEDVNKKNNRKIFNKKGKVSIPIDHNILTVLSIYADTPDCLSNYLDSI